MKQGMNCKGAVISPELSQYSLKVDYDRVHSVIPRQSRRKEQNRLLKYQEELNVC